MSIEAERMTVWHLIKEDREGRALYRVRVGDAYIARGAGERKNGVHAHPIGGAEDTVSGFFLPECAIGGTEIPFFLVPDRDFIAPGCHTADATPTEAAEHGAAVYRVTSSVQPPRISDGTLVNWSCFEGVRMRL